VSFPRIPFVRNLWTDLGVKGSLIFFGVCMIIAAFVIFVIWPLWAGVCVWNLGGVC